MSDHARLSPSSRQRWALCPGSVNKSEGYPDVSGPSAKDGTHSHTLLEHCIKRNIVDARGLVGETLTDDDGSFIVDIQRADRVNVALDYIKSRDFDEVRSEGKVNPEWLLGRNDVSGTVDVIGFDNIFGAIEIIDYKDGMVAVDAKDNHQMQVYALGVLSEFQLSRSSNYPYTTVTMTIIQPKLNDMGKQAISSHTVKVSEILDLIPVITAEASATDQEDAPLVPGEKQCKWCKAKNNCNARADSVMVNVSSMFEALPSVDFAIGVAQQNATDLPNQKLQELFEAAPVIRKFLDDVESEVLRRMSAGNQKILGLKLVNGRGSRVWNLPDEEVAARLKKMGVPKSEIFVTKLVSPAAATKLSWSVKDGEVKSLSKRQIELIETEYITKLAGKLTVVPESDSRNSAVSDTALVFSAVPQQVTQAELPSWLKL